MRDLLLGCVKSDVEIMDSCLVEKKRKSLLSATREERKSLLFERIGIERASDLLLSREKSPTSRKRKMGMQIY